MPHLTIPRLSDLVHALASLSWKPSHQLYIKPPLGHRLGKSCESWRVSEGTLCDKSTGDLFLERE